MPTYPPGYRRPRSLATLANVQSRSLGAAEFAGLAGAALLAVHLVLYMLLIGIDTLNGINADACRANSRPDNWDMGVAGKCAGLRIHGIVHNLMVFPGLSLVVVLAIAGTAGTALACRLAAPVIDRRAVTRHNLALDADDEEARSEHYLLDSVELVRKGRKVTIRYCCMHEAQEVAEPHVYTCTLPAGQVSWIYSEGAMPGTVNFPEADRLGVGNRAVLYTRTQPAGIQPDSERTTWLDRLPSRPFNQ